MASPRKKPSKSSLVTGGVVTLLVAMPLVLAATPSCATAVRPRRR